MQRLAAEMNLSETAVARPSGDEFELRWFTPKLEVDLCRHATLAAAHEEGMIPPGTAIHFRTRVRVEDRALLGGQAVTVLRSGLSDDLFRNGDQAR